MDLLFLSIVSTALCVLVVIALKYLSLLRYISGNAYVLSKKKDHFSILEILDLFKNVRPFPISNQKGWKIDNYAHGHRIWFNFLTFPHNLNAPSIKVFAVFDRVGSSSQVLLQVLRDIGQTCEWKPGVVSTSHTNTLKSHGVSSLCRGGLPSMPVQADCIKEERLLSSNSRFSLQYHDPWVNENVIPTTSVEFKRFWHREDNGVCWLLQMNEKLQTCEFYLIQPVADVEQCLLSVVTWSRSPSLVSRERASILLSSLAEYMSVRRLQKTPLLSITLPQDLSDNETDSSDSSRPEYGDKPLFNSFKKFIMDKQSAAGGASPHSATHSTTAHQAELEKYSSILKYKSKTVGGRSGGVQGSNDRHSLQRSVSALPTVRSPRQPPKQLNQDIAEDGDVVTDATHEENKDDLNLEADHERENKGSGKLDDEVQSMHVEDCVSEEDIQVAQHKTLSNQSAAELLAEAVRASNIDLQLTSDKQAESSGGWLFSSFEKNIVVLKKVQSSGSTVQSYIGKGFVLAPPKIVWDAVRNPRTRFTYDETLKKVDIIETLDNALKIVYYYHESQQFLVKTSCDMCVLQGERQEGDKYVLTYTDIQHHKCPQNDGIIRAKFQPSGWIIEPARQDNKVYSIVTYLMQVDFGPSLDGSTKLPFEEMLSRYPLSIAYLQQYLKPALQMLRRKSLT